MDFSDNESWDSTPYQEAFIQSYFKKRKISATGPREHEKNHLLNSAVPSKKKRNHGKKTKKQTKPCVLQNTMFQSEQSNEAFNITPFLETVKDKTFTNNQYELKYAKKNNFPKDDKNISSKMLKNNIQQNMKLNSQCSELRSKCGNSDKSFKKLKKISNQLPFSQKKTKPLLTVGSIENKLSKKHLQLVKKEVSMNILDDVKEVHKSFPKITANVCNSDVKIEKLRKKESTVPHSNKINEEQTIGNSCSSNLKESTTFRNKAQKMLNAAKFRYLNEKLYTESGKEAFEYFQNNVDEYVDYHEGFNLQVLKWPINPVNVIISDLRKINKNAVIADMGCGDAKIARSFPVQVVHSFDLIALNECVTACDVSKVPLPNESVDIVIFCLSLMGTNLKDYLIEAHRILKQGGTVKIAEVESRISSVEEFVKSLKCFGFALEKMNIECKMFVFFDFKKVKGKLKRSNLTDITLKPCLYKKR